MLNSMATISALNFRRPIAISADGRSVVGEMSAGDPAIWNPQQGYTRLGDIDPRGISGDGLLVVGTGLDRMAAYWTASTGIRPLPVVSAARKEGSAYGASRDGSIIVGSQDYRPCLWRNQKEPHVLSGEVGQMTAVSADGSTAAGTIRRASPPYPDGNDTAAVFSNRDLIVLKCGYFPYVTYAHHPTAISPDATAIVGYTSLGRGSVGDSGGYDTARAGDHDQALRCSKGPLGWSKMVPVKEETFETLAGRDRYSKDAPGACRALGASNRGQAIVGFLTSRDVISGERSRAAFYWTPRYKMQNVRALLVSAGTSGADGWELLEATALSADGRTIVGVGYDPAGEARSWIAHLDIAEVRWQ